MKINVTGGWIDLREPEEVPEKLRRPIIKMSVSGVPFAEDWNDLFENPENANAESLEAMLDYGSRFNDLVAMAFIRQWSFELPISIDALGDLPGKVYDEIANACKPLISNLMPSFEVDPDPKVITEA